MLDEAQASGHIQDDALDGKTIMVLDDQEEAHDSLEAVLMTVVGASVAVFASGDEALTHLRDLPRNGPTRCSAISSLAGNRTVTT